MGVPCKPCSARAAIPRLDLARARAAAVASAPEYEVLDAKGKPTGRYFTSLVAATGFANRIGGTTRPK